MRGSLSMVVGVCIALARGHAAEAQPSEPADYRVTVVEATPTLVGERGAVSLTIAAEPGHAISREGPLRITVTLPTGASTTKRRYVRADAADARADNPRFDLRYRIDAAGEYTMNVQLSFWVCATRSCRPVSVQRSATVRGVDAATVAPSP
jgi:hypothetical protein